MENINAILKEKGLTKQMVAKRMGTTRENLYRILNGNPTLDNLQKLAIALEVPVSTLFEDPKTDIINCPHCGKKIKIIKG